MNILIPLFVVSSEDSPPLLMIIASAWILVSMLFIRFNKKAYIKLTPERILLYQVIFIIACAVIIWSLISLVF
jgi:hypothetical protein